MSCLLKACCEGSNGQTTNGDWPIVIRQTKITTFSLYAFQIPCSYLCVPNCISLKVFWPFLQKAKHLIFAVVRWQIEFL